MKNELLVDVRKLPADYKSRIVHRDGGWRVEDPLRSIKDFQRALPEDLVSIKVIRADGVDKLNFPVYWSRVVGKGRWSGLEPSRHWGKGFSPIQARASAAFESIERLCARVLPGTAFINAAYDDVKDTAVDPRILIQDSAAIRKRHIPFRTDILVDWSEGIDLVSGEERLVASTFVHFPYPAPEGEAFANQGTNGLAAGNSYAEAVLQGALELVERDSTYIFLRNRLVAPEIKIDSSLGSKVSALIERLNAAGIEVRIKNLTSDIGIAVVGVTIFEGSWRGIGLGAHGYGAHLDPVIALERAITEAIQCRTFILHTVKSLPFGTDPAYEYIENSGFFGDDFLNIFSPLLDAGETSQSLEQLPQFDYSGIEMGVETCVERISSVQRNKAVIALNLTRPEINIPVVKVIAPGLQDIDHMHYSCAERMLTLPRKLGYMDNNADEISLFTGFIP